MTPCSPLIVNRRFRGTYRLHLQGRISRTRYQRESSWQAFTLVFCSAYSTLKMETICSSETSIDFQRITRCCISEDSILHKHGCENFKSCKMKKSFRDILRGRRLGLQDSGWGLMICFCRHNIELQGLLKCELSGSAEELSML
jgi:hypothetical protein